MSGGWWMDEERGVEDSDRKTNYLAWFARDAGRVINQGIIARRQTALLGPIRRGMRHAAVANERARALPLVRCAGWGAGPRPSMHSGSAALQLPWMWKCQCSVMDRAVRMVTSEDSNTRPRAVYSIDQILATTGNHQSLHSGIYQYFYIKLTPYLR